MLGRVSEAILVRRARAQDAAAIAGIHVGAWQAAYRGHLDDELLDGLSRSAREQTWRERLQDGPGALHVLVATREGRVQGFAATTPAEEDEPSRPVGELGALYVDPDCWSTGVGRALLDHAVAHMAELGNEEAVLWVLTGNERARRFYEHAGWSTDGRARRQLLLGTGGAGASVEVVSYRRALR